VNAARDGFVIPPMPQDLSSEERQRATSIIAESLVSTVRIALWIAAALALASALVTVVAIPPRQRRSEQADAAAALRRDPL
jgi:hypothetical protein